MQLPLQRSVLPGIEEHLGPTEQLLSGVRGVGKLGDPFPMKAKVLGVLLLGGIVAPLFVYEGYLATLLVLLVLVILNATPYALVLTDTSALIVRLSRRGRVLEVQRFDRDAFPEARTWSTPEDTYLRIELEPPLQITNPKLLDRSHSYDAIMGPLGIDTSKLDFSKRA